MTSQEKPDVAVDIESQQTVDEHPPPQQVPDNDSSSSDEESQERSEHDEVIDVPEQADVGGSAQSRQDPPPLRQPLDDSSSSDESFVRRSGSGVFDVDDEEQPPPRRRSLLTDSDDDDPDLDDSGDESGRPGPSQETVADVRRKIGATKADLREARVDLRRAQTAEAADLSAKGQWDEQLQQQIPVEATSQFWKGSDWTGEEKRKLATAQATLVTGVLGGIALLAASAVSLVGAKTNLEAAHDRLATANETSPTGEVNTELYGAALDGLASSSISTFQTALAFLGTAVVKGAMDYWDVLAKHAENVKALNKPDVTKDRERLQAVVRRLEAQLKAEQDRLRAAILRARQSLV